MTHRRNEDIKRLIDYMQTGLVELFDQLRELRRLLDMPVEVPLPSADSSTESSEVFTGVHSSDASSDVSSTSVSSDPAGVSTPFTSAAPRAPRTVSDVDATLAVFAEKVRSGSVTAVDLAASLKSVKSTLITPSHPNERVERDMDIVLKFLHKRGKRGIRPEERDNILKRIQRWKAHLASDATGDSL